MRATVRLCLPLGVVLALLPSAAAHAKIAPILKPSGASSKPAAKHSGSHIVPVLKPHVTTPRRSIRVRLRSPRRAVHIVRRVRARTRRVAPLASRGGRVTAKAPKRSLGGRRHPTSVPAIVPTPLGFAGIAEPLPAPGSWPSWALALFTLLASVEAYLLATLVRARRFARVSAF